MLDYVPVLQGVNGTECGLVALTGNIVVTKGQALGGVAQALEGITGVRRGRERERERGGRERGERGEREEREGGRWEHYYFQKTVVEASCPAKGQNCSENEFGTAGCYVNNNIGLGPSVATS